MKEIETIIAIYDFTNPRPENGKLDAYYLLYLLDEKGLLDIDLAHNFYNKFMSSEERATSRAIGPFESLENLNQFSFQLCEELNASKVSLLSVLEYNTLLESSHQAADFHRDLVDKGNVMENIDRKKKGLFSKIFN